MSLATDTATKVANRAAMHVVTRTNVITPAVVVVDATVYTPAVLPLGTAGNAYPSPPF
jgi:hypothetical protein